MPPHQLIFNSKVNRFYEIVNTSDYIRGSVPM